MSNETGFCRTTKFSSVIDGADFCEHVQEGSLTNAVGYFFERDSFGPVSVFVCCEACKDKSDKEEEAILVCCNDCKKEVPQGQTIAWKCYDFYAAQGDEPTIVCYECRGGGRHLARVAQDARDYDNEFGHSQDDDDGLSEEEMRENEENWRAREEAEREPDDEDN